MCAINGCSGSNYALVERMNSITKHRGPDGSNVWAHERVTLGQNRLAVIDLSDTANQPMHSTDGRLTIVFNGEIYNYRELRAELVGYQFKTNSDTEVILAAYSKWGKSAFEKFNGMFAFALWDNSTQELILVRDRVGIKPLYYTQSQGELFFSSEIKGVLECGVLRKLDLEAFNEYLRVLYVPAPRTMFAGVYKLMPGMMLVYKEGNVTLLGTYLYDYTPEASSEEPFVATPVELYDTVERAVTRQLVADVPVGVYLSGGVDSSAVLHSMAQTHGKINTFSVGFELTEAEESAKFNADFLLARRTAKHYGTTHHELLMRSDEAQSLFERAVWHLDEPISNPTILPMFALAQETKKHVTVALGGDGGDELFGGYERYRWSLRASYYQKLPSASRDVCSALSSSLRKLNTPPGVLRFEQFMFQKDQTVSRVVKSEYLTLAAHEFFSEKFAGRHEKTFEDSFMKVDEMTWLVDESLMRSDKMSMAAGLETRVPLLDNELLAFSQRLSRGQKVTLWETKKILKTAFKGHLPDYLFSQPKRGWFSPGAKWLRHERFSSYAREVLCAGYYSPTSSLFNWPEVTRMLERHERREEYNLTMLWALLTFQAWARAYKIEP